MLITTCPSCRGRFRVTPQQLNARQGKVRCGRCANIFNGFQSLERFPDDDTGARLLAAQQAQKEEPAPELEEVRSFTEEPIPSLDSESAPQPPAAEPPPEPMSGPEPIAPVTAEPAPGIAPWRAPEITLEPPPRARAARAWTWLAVLMGLALALEAVFALRGPLAQRYPALRPALEAACEPIGCAVPWAREEGLLKLEESEMLEVPGKPGEIALGARIRNLASFSQEYPHLELTLTDLTGQAAARRVLRPTDYLGRPVAAGEVLAPGVEVALQLRLATPRIKATGYELLLFYP